MMRIVLVFMWLLGRALPFQASPTNPAFHEVVESSTTTSLPLIEPPEYHSLTSGIGPYSIQHRHRRDSPIVGVTARSHSARLPLVQRQHQHDHRHSLVRHSYPMALDDAGFLLHYREHDDVASRLDNMLTVFLRNFFKHGMIRGEEEPTTSSSALFGQQQQRRELHTWVKFLGMAGLGAVGLAATANLVAPLYPLLVDGFQNVGLASTYMATALFSVAFWANIAPLASIALKLSPLPSIRRIAREQTTGGLPLLPYSAMCTMTFCLVVYGFLVDDLRIMITHGAGHVLSLGYCATFVKNFQEPNNKKQVERNGALAWLTGKSVTGTHARLAGGIIVAMLTSVAVLGREAAPIAGTTSVVLSCLMYTGPLAALREAIRSKSARNIPLPYALASIVNAIAWTIYGYFQRHDWMVWAPGTIGLASATMQVIVHILYGTRRQ